MKQVLQVAAMIALWMPSAGFSCSGGYSAGDGGEDTVLDDRDEGTDAAPDGTDAVPDGADAADMDAGEQETAYCGNGFVEGDEQCDDGDDNSDVPTAACGTNCRPPFLGKLRTDAGPISAFYWDIQRDNNNDVHIIWITNRTGSGLHYGRIAEDYAVVDYEEVPGAGRIPPRKYRPRLTVKPDGTEVHVAWAPLDGSGFPYRFVDGWRDSSGTWHIDTIYEVSTEPAPADQPNRVQHPCMGVDAHGIVHYVGISFNIDNSWADLMYFRKDATGWAAPRTLAPRVDNVLYEDVRLHVDPHGGMHVSWTSGSRDNIKYRYVESGGDMASDSTTVDVQSDFDKNKWPGVFVDRRDNVYLATESHDRGDAVHEYVGYTTKALADPDFSTPIQELYPGIEPALAEENMYIIFPRIAATSPDSVRVAWAHSSETAESPCPTDLLEMAVGSGGAWSQYSFDDNVCLLFSNLDYTKPALTVTGDTGYLVWRDPDGHLFMYAYYAGDE